MNSDFSQTNSVTKLVIIVLFCLVFYLIYSLTKTVYQNYKFDKSFEQFKEENALIEAENQMKIEDYLYFTSDEYIDKKAKQSLNLINPGEEVLVLSSDLLYSEEIIDGDGDYAVYGGKEVYEEWIDLFF